MCLSLPLHSAPCTPASLSCPDSQLSLTRRYCAIPTCCLLPGEELSLFSQRAFPGSLVSSVLNGIVLCISALHVPCSWIMHLWSQHSVGQTVFFLFFFLFVKSCFCTLYVQMFSPRNYFLDKMVSS